MSDSLSRLGLDWKLNPFLKCPHCGYTGSVKTRHEKRKAGVSGGKATGAIFTAGISLLATGLSRKVDVMACRCGNCNTSWSVEN